VIAFLAITTVIAGWALWLKNALSFPSIGDWLTSPFGLVPHDRRAPRDRRGLLRHHRDRQQRREARRDRDEVAASGGPPTPEQGARMAHLGAEIQKHSKIDLVLLFGAVFAMATARYW
jgi:hypothetical protein